MAVQNIMLAELIKQGKKSKEFVPGTTPDSMYKVLSIKLTDEVVTHLVQQTRSDRDPSARSVSEHKKTL